MTKSDKDNPGFNTVQLGKNDAAKGPHPYRTTPNLGESALFPDMQVVKPEEHGRFGTRTGRNERSV